jgi:hypothetical protein
MPTFADLLPGEFRGAGLSSAELDIAQEQAGVPFPPDLCELLGQTLPVGPDFPDWRDAHATMRSWREWLVEIIHFDVVRNGFWLPEWGHGRSFPTSREVLQAVHLLLALELFVVLAGSCAHNVTSTQTCWAASILPSRVRPS